MKQRRLRGGGARRAADPYRDVDVIDARAPRLSQATLGVLLLVAFATGWWPLVAILGLQWAVGLAFGRRYCLPCLVYFELVQPLLGEGPIEDARPPRFANLLGVVFLGAASAAFAGGVAWLGWTLVLVVAALALVAAGTGLCVGCELYRLGARVRGIRAGGLERIDPADVAAAAEGREVVVHFAHPLCSDCRRLEERFEDEGRRVIRIDVTERPDLARKYGVALVPTAYAVGSGGRVTARLAG